MPPENLAALNKVAQAVAPLGIPVATGERMHTLYECRELFELQAADILQPRHHALRRHLQRQEAGRLGRGLLRAHRAAQRGRPGLARPRRCTWPPATYNFKIQEHFNDFAEAYVKDAAPGLPEVVDGYFALPTGPGLGVTLNEDVIEAHPRTEVHFNLYKDDWHKRAPER